MNFIQKVVVKSRLRYPIATKKDADLAVFRHTST